MMPDDLLAEATALADTHYGPDPVAEAATVEADYRGVPEPDYTPVPDPDVGKPYAVNGDHIFRTLSTADPDFVIRQGGREFVDKAVTFLHAVPREVVGSMDEVGMLGSPHTWALMADLGVAIGAMTSDDIEKFAAVPEIVEIEAYARESEFSADVETVSNIRVFLSGLPPPVRAAASHLMLTDDVLWEVAAAIGGKLWGYTAMYPPTARSKH